MQYEYEDLPFQVRGGTCKVEAKCNLQQTLSNEIQITSNKNERNIKDPKSLNRVERVQLKYNQRISKCAIFIPTVIGKDTWSIKIISDLFDSNTERNS